MCPGVQDLYYFIPRKNPEVFDRYIQGLIKAGFKGDPSGYYKLHKENKMTGQEIRDSMLGKTTTGQCYGYQWSIKESKSGECELVDFFGAHKGKTWIEGDAVCRQYERLYDGLKDCADIYKNPEGDKKTLSEYLSLTDYGLFPFSIKE